MAFSKISFYCNGITFSPIQGGDGNIEYLAYFKKSKNELKSQEEQIKEKEIAVKDAFEILK